MIPYWVRQKLREVEECLPWQPSRGDVQNPCPTGLAVPLSSLSCCPTCTSLLLRGGAQQLSQQPSSHVISSRCPQLPPFCCHAVAVTKDVPLREGYLLSVSHFQPQMHTFVQSPTPQPQAKLFSCTRLLLQINLNTKTKAETETLLRRRQGHTALWQNWPCLCGKIIMPVATAFIFPHLYSLLHQKMLPKGPEHVVFTT